MASDSAFSGRSINGVGGAGSAIYSYYAGLCRANRRGLCFRALVRRVNAYA